LPELKITIFYIAVPKRIFDYMERNYYRQYYSLEREHWWFRVRAGILTDVFARRVGAGEQMKILNAGAATGRTSEVLGDFGTVTSVEPDSECCIFLREELKMEVTEASATALPFANNTFDVVCVFDVLEHIMNDQQAVCELHRVNKESGWLMLTVPAYPWLWSMHDEINHHCRRYTWREIKKLLQTNGYKIEYITGFNVILFFPIAAFRLVTRIFRRKNAPLRSDFDIPVLNNRSFVNRMLYKLFNLERKMLSAITFPFGVSILVLAKKV
jgi:SAM-dependent methyltransferase